MSTAATKTVPLDWIDKVDGLVLKLNALLLHTCGESGGSFRNLNDEVQDGYMMACSDLAHELHLLTLNRPEMGTGKGCVK